jgi:glycosyltransferase involved in cell wall biosynthesis
MLNKILLSICIPTYNRPFHLENCLESIFISKQNCKNFKFEVCISDNGSKHNIAQIVRKYSKKMNIKFNRFNRNKGITVNFLKAVALASGEFVWTMGNDDLFLPSTLSKIKNLLTTYKDVDYFFINSYHLNSDHLLKYSKPFSTYNLPRNMKRFSNISQSKKVDFWQVIDPDVSFDFLLGMFLSLFRRAPWNENLNCLNKKNIKDKKWMSNTDNTFFNTMIFANAFKNSKAFIQATPLSVSLSGVREWTKLYTFVLIVRIPEILDYYRSRGLPLWRYFYCKNYSFKNFAFCMYKIITTDDQRIKNYFNLKNHFFKNLIYPNVYLSVFYYIYSKIKVLLSNYK